jgi:hypothetical protein
VSPFGQDLLGVTHGQVRTMGVDVSGPPQIPDLKAASMAAWWSTSRVGSALRVWWGYRRSQVFDQRLNRVQVGVDAVWALTKR